MLARPLSDERITLKSALRIPHYVSSAPPHFPLLRLPFSSPLLLLLLLPSLPAASLLLRMALSMALSSVVCLTRSKKSMKASQRPTPGICVMLYNARTHSRKTSRDRSAAASLPFEAFSSVLILLRTREGSSFAMSSSAEEVLGRADISWTIRQARIASSPSYSASPASSLAKQFRNAAPFLEVSFAAAVAAVLSATVDDTVFDTSGAAAAVIIIIVPRALQPARRSGMPSSTRCVNGPKFTIRTNLGSGVTAL
mmetsp:Transcript_6428/g.10637  ORF Transcript_6428/g.10637 Transcript_6428/m.10637 type:complete len:254 (-) Transcript_6428:355-1116(-)